MRILVVNKTRLVCSVVAAALQDEPDIQVVGYATSVEQALHKANSCDIMAIDVHMPADGALALTRQIAEEFPNVRVLVTGVEEKPEIILNYIEAGAAGYVLEAVDVEQLVESIRAIDENKGLASPEMIRAFMSRLNALSKLCADIDSLSVLLDELTPREKEVLDLLREGKSNQDIADDLCIEVGTVKNHVHNILKKLDVESRHEAAALYERKSNGIKENS